MTDGCGFSGDNQDSDAAGRRRKRNQRGRRKERVLHTRISQQLSEDIRRLADDLRVPVSNLVRNVLEEVFTVVESVTDDVGDFFDDVVEEAGDVRERVRKQQRAARSTRNEMPRRRRSASARASNIEDEFLHDEAAEGRQGKSGAGRQDASDDLLGWQPMVLNRAVPCTRCGNTLARGADAMMAIRADGRLGSVICPPCSAKD